MSKYADDVIPVCEDCDKTSDGTKVCTKCAVIYCKHYASVTDYRFCGNCIADVQLKTTIMEKIVEHERPDGTISFSRKYQARRMTLVGNDWLFASHLIADMDDSEIDASVEYHRANVDLLVQERESRKQERYRKLANIKIVHDPNRRSQYDTEKASKKKTKTKDLSPDDLLKMLTDLAKSGLTLEQITAALGGGKK